MSDSFLHTHRRDLESCTFCPRLCRHTCVAAIAEATETAVPTARMSGGRLVAMGHLPLDRETAETFYSCSGCGACTAFCKHSVGVGETMQAARAAAFEAGVTPAVVRELVGRFETDGGPYGQISSPRTPSRCGPTVYVPGAAAWHYLPDSIAGIGRALEQVLGEKVTIAGADLWTGREAWEAGATELFLDQARRVSARLGDAERVIACDPAVAYTFTRVYPAAGLNRVACDLAFEVLSAAIRPEVLDLGPAAYHDPCHLGRQLGVYDPPRNLLRRLGYRPVELTRNRDQATCIGDCGVYRWTHPEAAARAASWRVGCLEPDPPPVLATVGATAALSLAGATGTGLRLLELTTEAADRLLQAGTGRGTNGPDSGGPQKAAQEHED